MDKAQIFKKIILPVLKTLADGNNFNLIDLIHQIVFQLGNISERNESNLVIDSDGK